MINEHTTVEDLMKMPRAARREAQRVLKAKVPGTNTDHIKKPKDGKKD